MKLKKLLVWLMVASAVFILFSIVSFRIRTENVHVGPNCFGGVVCAQWVATDKAKVVLTGFPLTYFEHISLSQNFGSSTGIVVNNGSNFVYQAGMNWDSFYLTIDIMTAVLGSLILIKIWSAYAHHRH